MKVGATVRNSDAKCGSRGFSTSDVSLRGRCLGAVCVVSREQATGLREINQSVNIMNQATQENAAMVEETTAASHGLAREVEALNRLLSGFKVVREAAKFREPAQGRARAAA